MRFSAMGLVFVLLIQVWMAAAMASPPLACCNGPATLAVPTLAATCCDAPGAAQLGAACTQGHFSHGCDAGGEDVSSDTPTCPSCAGDCGGTPSPFALAWPAGLPVVAAASLPTRVRVTSHLSPTPHRLDRPPSGLLY